MVKMMTGRGDTIYYFSHINGKEGGYTGLTITWMKTMCQEPLKYIQEKCYETQLYFNIPQKKEKSTERKSMRNL